MKAETIHVDLIHFITISECIIHKTVNNHATAKITGIVPDDEKIVDKISEKTWMTIYSKNGEEQQVLFTGIMESISMQETIGQKECEIELVGATRLLDIEEQTKTFQNAGMTFESLFQNTLQRHGASCIWAEKAETTLGQFYVQYKETDWKFLLRMASCMNMCVIPEITRKKIGFYVGLSEHTQLYECDKKQCVQRKEINCMRSYGGQMIRNNEVDDVMIWSSERVLTLGDRVSVSGSVYYVYAIKSTWEKSMLIHEYELRRKKDFEVKKHYNDKIVGASLDAIILEVGGSRVKVQISVDQKQRKESAKWFNYSTVFSSPDGTGWYCMPETGDHVRVYFPSEKEKDAYVISSVHMGEGQAARTNPDVKTIMNRFNKQIKWDDKSIVITNNNGITFEINDEDGIKLESNKGISFIAQEDVQIASLNANVEIVGMEKVLITQDGAEVQMEDSKINFKANEVHIQR